jgi:hypothetical protein
MDVSQEPIASIINIFIYRLLLRVHFMYFLIVTAAGINMTTTLPSVVEVTLATFLVGTSNFAR